MIGNNYPFFLENTHLGSAFYLYQVVSPRLDEELKPLATLAKVGEKVQGHVDENSPRFNSADIATYVTGKMKNPMSLVNLVDKGILNREADSRKQHRINVIDEGENEFPAFRYTHLNVRSVIVGLRDSLRWQQYRWTPGKQVDILLSCDKFGVFDIKGSNNEIWLELKNVYSINDPGMTTPIEGTSYSYPSQRFKGNSKASELNRAIRAREWKSFEIK